MRPEGGGGGLALPAWGAHDVWLANVTFFGNQAAAGSSIQVESDGPDLVATDVGEPGSGQVWLCVVRADNDCPQGVGTPGAGSDGAERAGRPCP